MVKANSRLFCRRTSSTRNLSQIQSRIGGQILVFGILAGLAAGSLTGCAAARAKPAALAGYTKAGDLTLQILDPRSETTSTIRGFVNILGRTVPGAAVRVGDESARVFATGIFARDQFPLQMGENTIKIIATARDGRQIERVVTLNRKVEAAASPLPPRQGLEIDTNSIEPARNAFLTHGDVLELSFRGTPGQMAEFRLPNADWRSMAEVPAAEAGQSLGLYRANLVVTPATDTAPEPVRFRLRSATFSTNDSRTAGEAVIEAASKAKVGFWDEATVRLAKVKDDGAPLSFGMHEVRLGGPYLAELPAGTLLRITGMLGNNYRVRISPELDGWVANRDVEWAPPGTILPHLAFTDLSTYGDAFADYVSIPYPARVPFSVTPTISPGGRAAIEIDFFGAHHAATWISHRPTAKTVREVTVKQVATEHLRVCVELQGRQLWGYQWSVTNNSLRLSVRRPPRLASAPASPLKGLTIALEPGHGGSNSGARGVSGSLEKDINRMAVDELARQFRAVGANPVIVRENDDDLSLGERTRRAIASNAVLFISVHANSAGHERGYLRVSGTSTYYKWPFSRDLSEAIHARLLAHTKLNDFGNVGSFNYSPIRANTWMPAMLVEQAFMSNSADEAKMLDPVFRKEMMRAVVLGTEDWLKRMRSELGR